MRASTASPASLVSVIVPSPLFLSTTRITNPKGCSTEVDKVLESTVIVLKGEVSTTRVQLPAEDRPLSALRLRYALASLQVKLAPTEHFALELTVSHSAVQQTRLVIGTHIREPNHDRGLVGIPTARLPLVIPRNRWVQVVFHIAGIVESIFRLNAMQAIDSVAFCGSAKIGTLKVSNSEQACIDATPDGFILFAVPAYAQPVWKTAEPERPKEEEGGKNVAVPPAAMEKAQSPREFQKPPLQADIEPVHSPSTQVGVGTPLTSRAASQSIPARLQPLSTRNIVSVGAPQALQENSQSNNTAGTNTPNPNYPSSSPPSARVDTTGTPPSLNADQPLLKHPVQGSKRPYIRLVSSATPRTSRQPLSSAAGRRSFPDSGNERNGNPLGADMCWWDDVAGWEGPAPDLAAAASSSRAKSGQTTPREKPTDGRPIAKRPPPKSKPKISPEAERMQRLVAARKRKVGLVGTRGGGPSISSTSTAAERSPATNPNAGNGSRRRHRARRRMKILRANEKETVRMAEAKALAPSELPLVVSAEGEADVAEGRSLADGGYTQEPKCGYGFGYMGVLHEGGDYEEDEGANLKGAWSLAISDDDE